MRDIVLVRCRKPLLPRGAAARSERRASGDLGAPLSSVMRHGGLPLIIAKETPARAGLW